MGIRFHDGSSIVLKGSNKITKISPQEAPLKMIDDME